jgi:FkbM family methyltransferase
MRKYIAQHIFNLILWSYTSGGIACRLRRFLIPIRRFWVHAAHDPEIRYKFFGKMVALNLSHDLPINRMIAPQYATNLIDISTILLTKYPSLRCIDIGANIGDSAIIIDAHASCPILCIEGEDKYFSLLQRNTSNINNVIPVKSFLYAYQGELEGRFQIRHGTANFLTDSDHPSSIAVETLEHIIERHPEFEQSKLLKIDTDGMDTLILKSALKWIQQAKPAIFTEYDPTLLALYDKDYRSIFRELAALGYSIAIVYSNYGDYLFTVNLSWDELLDDLHAIIAMRRTNLVYFDFCFFHTEDIDIVSKLRMQYHSVRT